MQDATVGSLAKGKEGRGVGCSTDASRVVATVKPRARGNGTLNAVVLQRAEVSPGLMVLRVAPDDWEFAEFEPGQFSVLGLPASARRCANSDLDEEPPKDPYKVLKRAYSVASSLRGSANTASRHRARFTSSDTGRTASGGSVLSKEDRSW